AVRAGPVRGVELKVGEVVLKVGGVVLWDVVGRKRLVDDPLDVKEGYVESVAFSPDGKTLAARVSDNTGGDDPRRGQVVAWGVQLKSWLRIAGWIANRNFTRDEWRQCFPDEPYRRTIRTRPWPSDLTEAERKQAEARENEHSDSKDAP